LKVFVSANAGCLNVRNRVANPPHFNADPETAFHINAVSDPDFHFTATPAPDAAPHQSDANLRLLA
jgi:hypothetical protein